MFLDESSTPAELHLTPGDTILSYSPDPGYTRPREVGDLLEEDDATQEDDLLSVQVSQSPLNRMQDFSYNVSCRSCTMTTRLFLVEGRRGYLHYLLQTATAFQWVQGAVLLI